MSELQVLERAAVLSEQRAALLRQLAAMRQEASKSPRQVKLQLAQDQESIVDAIRVLDHTIGKLGPRPGRRRSVRSRHNPYPLRYVVWDVLRKHGRLTLESLMILTLTGGYKTKSEGGFQACLQQAVTDAKEAGVIIQQRNGLYAGVKMTEYQAWNRLGCRTRQPA